jgi:alcohol/geraniol dehydrogenase (NADP+)
MIHAFVAHAPQQTLEKWSYEPADLGLLEAEVLISHCGVCHSDLHIVQGDWGGKFPVVPGHEIVGEIVALGAGADATLMGKRVGIGWQCGACMNCEWCLHGEENLCSQSQAVCFRGHYGGFAERVRVDSRFCHVIPDALNSENVAPLLCAGITVYAPLRRYAQGGTWRVGIVGIGGLGHLGVQYAKAMGADVTAFTTSPSKADEARQLGANRVVITTQPDALRDIRASLDCLLVTVNASLDWLAYAKTLRPNGVMCFVGAAEDNVNIPIGSLVNRQWVITGGSIGGRPDMRDMLQFSAQHGITAWTERLPMDSVNLALERLKKNDVRYRFVLER